VAAEIFEVTEMDLLVPYGLTVTSVKFYHWRGLIQSVTKGRDLI
jgi:hypothetical protein